GAHPSARNLFVRPFGAEDRTLKSSTPLTPTSASRPIIEFHEVGRRYSVKLKPGFLLLPPPPLRDIPRRLNIGNEALELSVDSSEANLSELTNKDGQRSSNIPSMWIPDVGVPVANFSMFFFHRLCATNAYFSLAKISLALFPI
ncbi:hypothetical protein ALC60_09781, partial [Trachymyrmex zeteki]